MCCIFTNSHVSCRNITTRVLRVVILRADTDQRGRHPPPPPHQLSMTIQTRPPGSLYLNPSSPLGDPRAGRPPVPGGQLCTANLPPTQPRHWAPTLNTMPRQTAATDYLKSNQLLLFVCMVALYSVYMACECLHSFTFTIVHLRRRPVVSL